MIGRGRVGRAFAVPAVSELTEYQLGVRRGVPRPLAARGLDAVSEDLRPCCCTHGETYAERARRGQLAGRQSRSARAAAIAAGGGQGTPRGAESDRSSGLPETGDGLGDDLRTGALGAGSRPAVVSPRERPEDGNELVAGVIRSTVLPTAGPSSSLHTNQLSWADYPWSDCSSSGEVADWTGGPTLRSRLDVCDRFPSQTWWVFRIRFCELSHRRRLLRNQAQLLGKVAPCSRPHRRQYR